MNKLKRLGVVSLGSLLLAVAVPVPMVLSLAESATVSTEQATIEPVVIEIESEPNEASYTDSDETEDIIVDNGATENIDNQDKTEIKIIYVGQTIAEAEEATMAPVIEITTEAAIEEAEQEVMLDQAAAVEEPEISENRSAPIYCLSKDGHVLGNQRVAEQWIVHDLAQKYNLPEKYLFGMILVESDFNPNAKSSANCQGLFQISPSWLRNTTLPTFEGNRRSRNLYNAYENTLTACELMIWARDNYGIDLWSEQGFKDYAYFHNTGKYKKGVSWNYSNKCIRYANELVKLQ